MHLRYFIIWLFLLLSVNAYSQQYNKDSVLKTAETFRKASTDTAGIRKMAHFAYDLIESDSILSYSLLKEAVTKSIALKESNTISNCYRLLGLWYSYFSYGDSAEMNYRASMLYAKKSGNEYLQAGANLNIGNIKYWQGHYDSCIFYYQEAAKIFEDPHFLSKNKQFTAAQLDKRKSDLYSNLSQVFNTLHHLPKADEYIEKAIALTKKYNSQAAQNAIAYYMQIKADNFSENNKKKEALQLRLAYLPKLEASSIERSYVQHAYQQISIAYFQLGNIDSSKYYAEKSYTLAKQIQSPSNIASASLQLAQIALKEKNNAVASQYLSTIESYYRKSTDPAELAAFLELQQRLKFVQGDYKAAYTLLDEYKSISDSLWRSKKALEFAEREMRYETEKKETQIKLQQTAIQRKNILNYSLIAAAVALLFICVLIYRVYQNKQKLQQHRIAELEIEKQLLATQSLLKGQEDERSRLAKDLHDGLGGLLSGVKLQLGAMKGNLILSEEHGRAFNHALNKLDESIGEMRRVAHNMMPEALMKLGLQQALQDYCDGLSEGQSFVINTEFYGLEKRMEPSVEIVVYRIVQELLNNAVKHAQATSILAQVIRRDENLTITVEDNGKGFEKELLNGLRTAGLQNIQSRVNYLRGQMDIQSAPGKGTSVHIDCTIETNG